MISKFSYRVKKKLDFFFYDKKKLIIISLKFNGMIRDAYAHDFFFFFSEAYPKYPTWWKSVTWITWIYTKTFHWNRLRDFRVQKLTHSKECVLLVKCLFFDYLVRAGLCCGASALVECLIDLDFEGSKIIFAFNKSNFRILKVFILNLVSSKINSRLTKIDIKLSKNL